MLLVDPAVLTLFPPARWAGRTAVVEICALAPLATAQSLDDADFDQLEQDLRGIVARRLRIASPADQV
jgi:hypothetical protein